MSGIKLYRDLRVHLGMLKYSYMARHGTYLNAEPIRRKLSGTVAKEKRDWVVVKALKCY